MNRIYLDCRKDGIMCKFGDPTQKEMEVSRLCRNKADLKKFFETYEVLADVCLCSSSMDFPEEYTKDRKIIDLCYRIRGGKPPARKPAKKNKKGTKK